MIRGLDLGGSECRLGISKDEIVIIPSPCLEIEADAPVKDYLAQECSKDDFVIEVHPMRSLCGRRFVREDTIDHYNGRLLYCDNQTEKSVQEITYINAAYALAISGLRDNLDDFEVETGICIPTSEYYSDEDFVSKLKQGLTGHFKLYFPLLNKHVEFNIADGGVKVTPEGVVAAMQFAKEPSFREGITLIIDVGKRSTDITLLKNFKPIGRSAVSRPIGGVNIEAYVRGEMEREGLLLNTEQVSKLLTRRYIIKDGNLIDVTELVFDAGANPEKVKMALFHEYTEVTDADVNNAMNKYFIKQGSSINDVSAFVTEAKSVFASNVKRDITDVLDREMLTISAVNNIVPIGRVFGGDLAYSGNLVHILMEELNCTAGVYPPTNLATANVQAIMAVMGNR